MLLIIPIRTECSIRRVPRVNYALLGINFAAFMLLSVPLTGGSGLEMETGAAVEIKSRLALHAEEPALFEFVTYQFLHADVWHLLGNMLFLWVFGNGVNAKMGDAAYLLFYISSGVFAGWGFTLVHPDGSMLVGASGAIAAVTAAFLVLFPRSHVTVLIWLFIFIQFIELPAMVWIGLKVIVWDNIVAPRFGGAGAVATSAHLAGYLFGVGGTIGLMLVRGLPRDQFDILALWRRWHQRRAFASAMARPGAAARARFGSVARTAPLDAAQRAAEERRMDELASLRTQINEALERGETASAAALYEKLQAIDAKQCLSEREQLAVARQFLSDHNPAQAAGAFQRHVDCYPHAVGAGEVRMLLGIIYARDLGRHEEAAKTLSLALESLHDASRLEACRRWLDHVRAALGGVKGAKSEE